MHHARSPIVAPPDTATDHDTRTTEALIRTAALQSAIFNSANFASIATDVAGVIQIFSVGAERMLGYDATAVLKQRSPVDFMDAAALQWLATERSMELGVSVLPGFGVLVCHASRGHEDVVEVICIRCDGSRFPVVFSVTALHDVQNCIIGYLLVGTDDTARTQIKEEQLRLDQRLRDQHFYTRSLIESSLDALMMTDTHGFITDVNKQTETLTGYTRDELVGTPFRRYFTESSRADLAIHRVLREGHVSNYELTARARDGKLTVLACNATTFHDRDRRLQGVIACARDMTEVKTFERTLQLKNAQLEDASRLKSEFLANMSHELRTPLNAIIGFSEVLKDGLMGELTDQQRGFIGDIFSSGNHLLELINDILDLSKVEAGKMTLELESVPVGVLLVNSLSIIREKAASRRIRLAMVDTGESLGALQLDTRKLKQVIYNLLSNAVKFTPEGGQVVLRAERVPRAHVGTLSGAWQGRHLPLAGDPSDSYLRISVTDSGIGISAAALDLLFEPFTQVDTGLGRQFEGTGLGLALVKSLVELQGGAVAVESAIGEGSCFTVWIPCRESDAVPAPTAQVIGRNDEPSYVTPVALVVEDDPKSAGILRLHLESDGFQVLHASSAEAALVLAARQPLALITLDIMLPNMDGWEFLAQIKETPMLARVPVVIISMVVDHNKGFALGAAAMMQKPVSRRELCESLVGLGLFPRTSEQSLKVLIVDDDPKAIDLMALRLQGMATEVLTAQTAAEAIRLARDEVPELILLDLMMPDVTGFDVVDALQAREDTACIPIVVVTAKDLTAEDYGQLQDHVSTIMGKGSFDAECFSREVRRALSGRRVVV
ncbi:response regulator [Gemmatimonas groenlandica]|uniref:histidine kinase n=1 Tax=Gemmatimonas groenlandica TaxID=2732249 RepID=A0A6M4IPQ5_9BACT|nr:response regulator [Gemmatimonas groenlandica]QJR35426.1 response regulator [Gemmatimonas groenlandica]